jgi:hypothetical protein
VRRDPQWKPAELGDVGRERREQRALRAGIGQRRLPAESLELEHRDRDWPAGAPPANRVNDPFARPR